MLGKRPNGELTVTRRKALEGAVAVGTFVALRSGRAYSADWQSGAGSKWSETLAAARKEGRVVIAGRAGLAKPLSEAFKRDTGLELDFLEGNGAEQTSRVKLELQAGKVTIDGLLGGAANTDLIAPGLVEPIKDRLMLPGVTNPASWQDGDIKWLDNAKKYMPIPSETVVGWPVVNARLVPSGSLRSWQNLLSPQYTGKIAMFDPRILGAGQAVAAYLVEILGFEYLRKILIDQKATLTRDARQLVEWVARGSYSVGLGAIQSNVERLKDAGLDVRVDDLEDGHGFLLGGNSVMWIPKGPPHPNATTVFANWYLSQPAQEIYARADLSFSRRTDVSADFLPDYIRPKPNLQYFDQYRETWYVEARPKLQKMILDAFGGR